jgi:hypothetical protein
MLKKTFKRNTDLTDAAQRGWGRMPAALFCVVWLKRNTDLTDAAQRGWGRMPAALLCVV